MNIKQFSVSELEKELERRKRLRVIPNPVDDPDYKDLIGVCKQYLHELAEYGHADDDYEHYIFEAAMTAIFGKDVWKFVNSKF